MSGAPEVAWSRKKKDDAPRGLFRHSGGGWGIRYTCGAGHIHEEKVGPIKGDALRAHAARRARGYAEPGWCPAHERKRARQQAQVAAIQAANRVTFRQYAQEFYLPWALLKRQRSYKTIRTEVTWLVSVLGEQWLSAVTPTQLERVLDDLQRGQSPSGRALSGAAVNRYRARLSGMFKRAMKRGSWNGIRSPAPRRSRSRADASCSCRRRRRRAAPSRSRRSGTRCHRPSGRSSRSACTPGSGGVSSGPCSGATWTSWLVSSRSGMPRTVARARCP